jgi:hypothetical protein
MKRIIWIILAACWMFTTTGCVFNTTGETEVGVRTRKFSLTGKGVEDKAYAPGSTYIFLPFINDWHTFDTKLQNLEMVFEQARGDRRSRDNLLFKTTDINQLINTMGVKSLAGKK